MAQDIDIKLTFNDFIQAKVIALLFYSTGDLANIITYSDPAFAFEDIKNTVNSGIIVITVRPLDLFRLKVEPEFVQQSLIQGDKDVPSH